MTNRRAPYPHNCADDAYAESLSFHGQYCNFCWSYNQGAMDNEKRREKKREGIKIFIGHGRSQQWRDLKDYIAEKLNFNVSAYESGVRAGYTIIEVLDEMSKGASLAFLVHTAEDKDSDGDFHARENVIHETGIFQGKLGFKRAIILLEEGCREYSNIRGLEQIRFSKNNIRETFGEVGAILHREFPDLL